MSTSSIFGERLKYLRILRGFTQVQLATILHAQQYSIANYESGKYLPKADALVQMAHSLNTSADFLLGITGEPEAEKLPIESLDEFETEAVNILKAQDFESKRRLLEIWRLTVR